MNISNKILDKADAKLRTAGALARNDINVVDYQSIDSQAGMVLLAYDRNNVVPTGNDIALLFQACFGAHVVPKLETARHHEAEACISLMASAPIFTRPIEEATTMTMVHATAYMDKGTNQVWDVANDDTGHKILVRRSDENIAALVEGRKRRQQRSTPKLAGLQVTAAVDAGPGDRVRFYDQGLVAYGLVESCNGGTCSIKTSTGVVKVDRAAIFNVVQKAQTFIADEKSELDKYFEKAYGDAAFADKLTHTTVLENSGGHISPFGMPAGAK